MSELPQGWVEALLSELCIFNPKHDSSIDRTRPVSFIPMPAISDIDGIIEDHESRPLGEVWKGYTHFQDGDVIFAKITPCMENGKIAVARDLMEGMACGSTEFHVLRPYEGISPECIWYFLRQSSFRLDAERHMTGAVGQRRVPKAYLENYLFPLPPENEQRRITVKLNRLSQRTRRAREELSRIPLLIEHYKQAILAAAFRGDLTGDWREDNPSNVSPNEMLKNLEDERRCTWSRLQDKGNLSNRYKSAEDLDWSPNLDLPVGWLFASVDQLVAMVQYGSSAKTLENTSGIPVLRMGNIQDGELDLISLKYLPEGHHEFPELLLDRGDILFNRTNSAELVGKTAVFHGEQDKVSFASYLIRLKACGMEPELLAAYINSCYGRDWVASVVSQQVGQANVNGSKLRRLGVPVMPREEQRELVSRIREANASIGQIAADADAASMLLDHLDQANLAKAFRGELVPQDRDDEPASALLERIRSKRAVRYARGMTSKTIKL